MGQRRREVRDRLLAVLLLGGFLLLNGAPLCGGPADVDAPACCQRHGCQMPMPQSRQAASHTIGYHGSVDAVAASNRAAEDCCRRGALVYPAVKNQSRAFATTSQAVLTASAPCEDSTFAAGLAACRGLIDAPPALPQGLYRLHSSYRI